MGLPELLLVVMAVAFPALAVSVVVGRRLTDRTAVVHDGRTCAECARLRHPSGRAARLAVAAMPRQKQEGVR